MKSKFILGLVGIMILSIVSCIFDGGMEEIKILYVYKWKMNYIENVPVKLSHDRSQITSTPSRTSMDTKPIELVNNYFLGGAFGLYTGYLSITRTEYKESEPPLSIDSLSKLILDNDPFIEFYQFNDEENIFHDDENLEFGLDTALLNTLILESRLEEYFIRLK